MSTILVDDRDACHSVPPSKEWFDREDGSHRFGLDDDKSGLWYLNSSVIIRIVRMHSGDFVFGV